MQKHLRRKIPTITNILIDPCREIALCSLPIFLPLPTISAVPLDFYSITLYNDV